ncbi:MAG: hypothetical protein CMC96_10095 [Flavobacteriales bacterium]|nr:hypothetical protein [Flavobacteriales bacterium]
MKAHLLKYQFVLLSLIFISVQSGFSQEVDEVDLKNNIIEQRVDFLLDANESGDADFTTLFEQLEYYYDKPINLNAADELDLIDLGLLNDIQINNLFAHIEKHGKLIAFEELQSIEGFDLESIRMIQPFTKVSGDLDQPSLSFKNIIDEGSSQFFLRYTRIVEEQNGYAPISDEELEENPNSRYLGSPDRIYSRYRFNYANNISLGFTAEKDPGEEFLQGSQPNGFDFYSAHLFLQGFGKVKQLAIGDFQAQFGQGLTFWSGLAFGRTPSIFTLKRNAPKLRQYTSVQEDLFLRGGGLTLAHNNFELTVFYSSTKVDANISGLDTLNNEFIVSSLSEDGFHRTESELEDKNAIRNTYLGGHLAYNKRNLKLGITAVHNEIGAQFQPREQTYNKFSNLDNNNTNLGFDYNYLYKNVNLFGEVSHSIDGGIAYTNGALIVIDPRLSLAIQNRKFQKDYAPLQSNAIGESSTNTNEEGTFIGINARLSEELTLSAYADRFAFKWLRFQTDAPSEGHRLLAQINYSPSRAMDVYFRFRQRNRGRNDRFNESEINQIAEESTTNYRLHFAYKITSAFQIKSRVELTDYRLGNHRENGLLIYQDLIYKQLSSPISFSARYALFDTDSYYSRIYAYESDVLYAFSIPAYNGRGSRFYITAKYHIARGVDFWLRYAQTYYTDRYEIGSGKEQINGNTKSEVKAQLRLKF